MMEISIIRLTPPPPPPMMENNFSKIFLGHFLRKSFENCILSLKMSNTCKKDLFHQDIWYGVCYF